jgi:membrane protein YdbS with pleckstrin-like domain
LAISPQKDDTGPVQIMHAQPIFLIGSNPLNNSEEIQPASEPEDSVVVSETNSESPVLPVEILIPELVSDVAEPKSADDSLNWQHLDIRHVALERLGGLLFSAFVLLGGAVGFLIWWLVGGTSPALWISLGSWVLVSGMLLWSAIYWPSIAHRHARWRLDETGLEIHRGVFWRHQISVPLARLQHADVSQGPLQRRFGLGKLIVHTAGTANASVELDGLAFEVAGWLRDQLITQRETLDVV